MAACAGSSSDEIITIPGGVCQFGTEPAYNNLATLPYANSAPMLKSSGPFFCPQRKTRRDMLERHRRSREVGEPADVADWHGPCIVFSCNPSLCQLGPGTVFRKRVSGLFYLCEIKELPVRAQPAPATGSAGYFAGCDGPPLRNAILVAYKSMKYLWFYAGTGDHGACRRSGGLIRPAHNPRRALRASSWSTRYRSMPSAASAQPLRTSASLMSRSPT